MRPCIIVIQHTSRAKFVALLRYCALFGEIKVYCLLCLYIRSITNVFSNYFIMSTNHIISSKPIHFHNRKPLWMHPWRDCLACAHIINNHINEITDLREVSRTSIHLSSRSYAYIEFYCEKGGKTNEMLSLSSNILH